MITKNAAGEIVKVQSRTITREKITETIDHIKSERTELMARLDELNSHLNIAITDLTEFDALAAADAQAALDTTGTAAQTPAPEASVTPPQTPVTPAV